MANPWKALADYIFVYKKDWDTLDVLEQDSEGRKRNNFIKKLFLRDYTGLVFSKKRHFKEELVCVLLMG